METKIINGQEIANRIYRQISTQADLDKRTLGVIQVGDDPGSNVFINQKKKAAENLGINFILNKLPKTISQADLTEEIEKFNSNRDITGFIVQLPLSKSISEKEVLAKIKKAKDVDGLRDLPNSIPCVALAVREVLHFGPTETDHLYPSSERSESRSSVGDGSRQGSNNTSFNPRGKMAVIIGDTDDVGQPIGKVLRELGAQVSFLNDKSDHVEEMSKMADILVSATGVAHLVGTSHVKEGAFVIDVGFNRLDGKVVGDVNTEAITGIAGYISPVPSGVGPVNVACLMRNLANI